MFQISLFDNPIEEKINEVLLKDLRRGSGFENSKERIRTMFNENISKADRIAKLKKEYGIGGRSGLEYSQMHGSEGLTISISNDERELYSWYDVHDFIEMLILADTY